MSALESHVQLLLPSEHTPSSASAAVTFELVNARLTLTLADGLLRLRFRRTRSARQLLGSFSHTSSTIASRLTSTSTRTSIPSIMLTRSMEDAL